MLLTARLPRSATFGLWRRLAEKLAVTSIISSDVADQTSFRRLSKEVRYKEKSGRRHE